MKIDLKSKKLWSGIAVFIILFIIAVVVISPYFAPEKSTATSTLGDDERDCLFFPTFSGDSLSGNTIAFPDAFDSDYTLVVMAFGADHLPKIGAWMEIAAELSDTYSDLSFYGIPISPELPAPAMIVARKAITALLDSSFHDNVVTVFLDNRDDLLEMMEISDFDDMQVFIVNIDDEIAWCMEGDFTEEKAEELRQQVDLLFD